MKKLVLCLFLCLVGCNGQQDIQDKSSSQTSTMDLPTESQTVAERERRLWHDEPRIEPTHFELEMSPEQISSTYAVHWQKRQDEKGNLVLQGEDIASIASNIKTYYKKGFPELANSLIESHPRIYTWEQSQEIVNILCVYQPNGYLGGTMEIKIVPKQPLSEDIIVCFPPGLYGKTLDPEIKAQNLGLLEAPVIQARSTTRITVNIACLSYSVDAPKRRVSYTLHKTPTDTGVYRLLVEICTGEFEGPDIQLALWVVGNKLSWKNFYHGRSVVTFGGRTVTPRASKGAANLIIKAGIDPSTSSYFGGKGETKRLVPPVKDLTPEEETPNIPQFGDISS